MELWLTSEDTGAYGKDIGVTLPELLWQLVEVIPEGAMLRIGMTNPPYILEHLEVCILALVKLFTMVQIVVNLIEPAGHNNSPGPSPSAYQPRNHGRGPVNEDIYSVIFKGTLVRLL